MPTEVDYFAIIGKKNICSERRNFVKSLKGKSLIDAFKELTNPFEVAYIFSHHPKYKNISVTTVFLPSLEEIEETLWCLAIENKGVK